MADEMFAAPINRSMKTLDRNLFKKTVQLKAARIFDNKNISRVRGELERSKVALFQDRLGSVHPDPDPDRAKTGKKCVVLRPEISRQIPDAGDTASLAHSPVLQELAKQELISIVPYDFTLDVPRHHHVRPARGRARRDPIWLLAGRPRRTSQPPR